MKTGFKVFVSRRGGGALELCEKYLPFYLTILNRLFALNFLIFGPQNALFLNFLAIFGAVRLCLKKF